MFSAFFYLLRTRGLDISMKEWLTLIEALKLGLHDSTMKGFYNLCLAILCKSESDYDKFGQAFLEFFNDGKIYDENGEVRKEITQKMMYQLNHHNGLNAEQFTQDDVTEEDLNRTREEIEDMLQDRLREQRDRKHDSGNYWVGTHGISPFGNSGYNPNGIRVGGQSTSRTAVRVAGERNYKDFRDDNVLDIRQFQMAFRLLQHYSSQLNAEEEFDVDKTIDETSKKAGILQIHYKKPRRNSIKVLLLMDSGGSMEPYSQLCSQLFQAASRSNRFKDLQVYYFHNCPDQYCYTSPTLKPKDKVPTRNILQKCDKDYRVILVGDATMDASDLFYTAKQVTYENMGFSGCDWLNYILTRYKHEVWLNPYTNTKFFGDWGKTYDTISSMFNMYQLTVAGLEQAMKKLMVRS